MSRLSYSKSVLKKLAKINNKTELKQEKIQLGLVQDGEQSANELLRIAEELQGIKKSLAVDLRRIDGFTQDGEDQLGFLKKVTREIANVNKELGITTKIPQLGKMERAIDAFNSANRLKV